MPWCRRVFELDHRSIALFRVLLSFVLLLDLQQRAQHLRAHYSDEGVFPRRVALSLNNGDETKWSLLFATGSPLAVSILFIITGCFCLMLMVGYRTKLATFVVWIMTLSIHNRNEMVIHFADQMIRCLLLWGLFLPLGRSYSLDEANDTTFVTVLSPGASTRPSANKTRNHLSMASIAYVFQIWFVYFVTAYLKVDPEWHSGDEGSSAIYFALSVDYYATTLGRKLLQHSTPQFLLLLTNATLVFEYVAPCALLIPNHRVRLFTIANLILLHIGLGACMILNLFTIIFPTAVLLLLPSSTWDAMRSCCRPRPRLTIRVPDRRIEQTRYLRRLCFWVGVSVDSVVVDKALANGIALKSDKADEEHHGDAATLALLQNSRVPGCLARRMAAWLQPTITRLAEVETLPIKLVQGRTGRHKRLLYWVSSALVFVCFVWIVGSNVEAASAAYSEADAIQVIPPPVRWIGDVFRLRQHWSMFAPGPPRDDGWFVFIGEMSDGNQLDPFRDGGPILWQKPDYVYGTYGGVRWLANLINIWTLSSMEDPIPQREEIMDAFSMYLCATWNSATASPRNSDSLFPPKLKHVRIHYMREHTLPYPKAPALENWKLWKFDCDIDDDA